MPDNGRHDSGRTVLAFLKGT